MRILLVDDNKLHLKMEKILLENLGHSVEEAMSLKELMSRFGEMGEIDIALIDYRLAPGETGVDVLNYLKSLNIPKIKYIAVTADVGEKKQLESAGFDEVVFKPVTENTLKEIIR